MKTKYYEDQELLSGFILNQGIYNVGFKEDVCYDDKRNREIAMAIWYPTYETMSNYYYRDIFLGHVAVDSGIINKRCPLIILSHGSEGHKFNQSYLAEYLVANGFICIAIEHEGDNALDNSLSKSDENLWHRPLDIKHVLDYLFNNQLDCLTNNIDLNAIGFAGHSFGGYTGLALLGGKIETYADSLYDHRIKCAFLMAPALSSMFYYPSLADIINPICLVVSNKDEFLFYDNIFFKQELASIVIYINFMNAGHYVYLMPCPIDNELLINEAACYDIGTKREIIHPTLKKHAFEFFTQHLVKG